MAHPHSLNPILLELTRVVGAIRLAILALDCGLSEIHIRPHAAQGALMRLRPLPARIHRVMAELQPLTSTTKDAPR